MKKQSQQNMMKVKELGMILENFERDVVRDEIKIIRENNEK